MADLRIACLVDNPNSWIIPHAERIGPVVHAWDDIPLGDILFVLGCERVIPEDYLLRNLSNVVIHPSALPDGRGWSPLAWQVLEGRHLIPVTLFEAAHPVDTGRIYLTDEICLLGIELNEEIKAAQGECTVRLARQYIDGFPMSGHSQEGGGSWYPRRTAEDSRLDPDKTLAEQFDLLRVVDNERYPAFFEHRGRRYVVKIHAA